MIRKLNADVAALDISAWIGQLILSFFLNIFKLGLILGYEEDVDQ